MTSKTTFYHVRRSYERGYEGSALPVDCLYAFETKDAAVKAAYASAHLTMSRYTGHDEKAKTMSDGSFDAVFETATYKFHVESFEMPSSREPRVIVNGKREMYALVCDDMIDSFHWTKSQANNTLNKMIKEIDGMQLDSGDLVEAVEVDCEYNEGLIRYQVQTVMNPNDEVYTENYGKDEVNKKDWFSCKLETIELVRVPVGMNAWSDKVVKNGGFTWHWTEFQGGVAGSFESVLDWLK
jgi:hypothetical protein